MGLAERIFDITGKTIVVTGASSGLGVTFAEALAGAGANVVLAARRKANIDDLAARICSNGAKALSIACDVTDSAAVASMLDAACDRFGRVDVLVNNAGQAAEAGVMPERVPDELFQQTIAVNVTGAYYCAREAAVRMICDGKGGAIVNIASIMGITGQQNGPIAYQASKAAVINMTRNMAVSWADRGVRVNCIAPGWFPSEMTAGWFAVPQFLERFKGQAPMNRVGEPRELIGALLLLVSDASSFMTGQTINVDGGVSAAVAGCQYDDTLFGIQAAVVGELGSRVMPG
ncbi:MAG: glucose 1-dehydrogenase [Dehalococcoidia bacterium]